jgi:sugar phosphate isomerase/epimerase
LRLGGFYGAETLAELEPICEELDRHGLSAISAPTRLAGMTDQECAAFGEEAERLGLVVGEAGMWENLMTRHPELQAERIEKVRVLLSKADVMGCRCVVTLVGSPHPSDSPLAPDPHMVTDAGKRAFREVVERILDGLELTRTSYAVEPWCNTFFYEPEDVHAFLASVQHPRLRLHLDLMNMVSQRSFHDTTGLVHRTFDLLSERIASVHLKDLRWDFEHMMLKWDEVLVGDGVLDYGALLGRLADLEADLTCCCEHLRSEAEYETNFARIHETARRAGVRFLPRAVGSETRGGT